MKPVFPILLLLSLVISFPLPSQPLPTPVILQTQLILHNQSFKQCHASTIVELKSGTLLVAFFGGSYEGAPDVKIWGTRQSNGEWSDPFVLADGRISDTLSYPCWNPVLFRSKAGKVYLFYKVGKNPREWFGMMKTSDDNGLSWSDPVRLPDGVIGPVKNKPIEISRRKILCPSSTETATDWKVQMELFNPGRNSWKIEKVDPESSYQVIQPTILTTGKSSYRILCRSKSNLIITALSSNNGRTWGKFSTIELPNPNSGIDGVPLQDGSYLLVYNPLTSGKEWVNGRNRLNLAWSADGLTWKDILVLEDRETGEYSYPAIIQSADGLVHITYTYDRGQVKYWRVRVAAFNL